MTLSADTARTPETLVADLRERGVQLWEDGGRLRFRAPRGVLTDEWREALAARKEAVLACLRAESPPVVRDLEHRYDPFPLTDVQSAYLLGRREAFAYGGVGCQVYAEMEYAELDPARLESAWNRLVERHDMLRAVISLDGHQRVLPEVPDYRIEVTDVRGASPAEAHRARAEVRAEMDHSVHDPERWPLFALRVTLTDACAVLHVSVDFLIADYLSVRTLMRELRMLYDGLTPPPLDITFRDYLSAAARRRESPAYERDRQYWTRRLDELPTAPELPVREGAEYLPGRFHRLSSTLSPEQWQAVRRACARWNLTPSATVLAALAEVIGRWSAKPRFCLNLTLLNREPLHPQVDRLVGDFTTVSPLAVDTAPLSPFGERARALQQRMWEDMDHRLHSGVEVMRELARRRGSAAALLPVVFTSTLGAAGDAGGPGEAAAQDDPAERPVHGISQTPQVWIDAQAVESDGCLDLRWDVREGVLLPGVAEEMFDALVALLRRLGDDAAVWEEPSPVPLPQAQQRRRDVANDTAAPLPDALLHDDLVAAARAYPDRPAVVSRGRTLSHGELLGRAEAVAARLREAGCTPGEVVGLVMDKGWEQVAGALGTLLAGCAYLPLDASQPRLRRDRILDDAAVRHVLVQSWSLPVDDCGRHAVAVDTLDVRGRDGEGAGAPPAGPDDLAYVVYTSGSTGAPKGVMVSHRAALNTLRDVNRRFDVTAEDRVLGLAGMGFDLSVYDVFGVLGAGGTLVLPDPERRADPSHWAQLLAEHRVTVWNSVPAQLQLLEDYLAVEPVAGLDALRLALLSGDWIPVTLPDRVRRRLPGLRLVSLGGATEAAVWSIAHPVGEVDPAWRSIPYGKPLANQTFHVLDPWLRPCPEHVPGELYIGGTGLALGYLGDAERTAERFVHHPRTGERLYRTGDRGVYGDDGVIEFLGRQDRQVKIRGHRIELAETEAALSSHPAVVSAHALVDGDGPLERRLLAYARLATGARPVPDRGTERFLAAASARGDAAVRDVDPAELAEFMRRLDRAGLLAMLHAFNRQGLFRSPGDRHTVPEVLEATAAAPCHHRLVRRWLKSLTEAGLLTRHGDAYAAAGPVGGEDLDAAWREVDALQREEWYKADLIGYFRTCAERLPELLRDEIDPLPLLFPEGGLDLSYAAYRDNVLSRYVNHAVVGLVRELAASHEGPLRLLEVGAGVGGTSTVLVPEIADTDVRYLFTDVSQFFLGEARRRFGDRVDYGLFDINGDAREQGRLPNSQDVVLCANVLHNARHVGTVLARLRELLAPGGWLVFIETTRENVQIMTSMEFMMPDRDPAKWDYEDLRRGRDQTFLDSGQWRRLLREAGADTVLELPHADGVTAPLGQRVFAARFKADRIPVRPEDVLEHAARRVPEYMLPARLELLDDLPLTANGKTDTAVLRGWAQRHRAPDDPGLPGAAEHLDDLERRVAAVWADLLRLPRVGRDDDFYRLGGDSLLVARLAGRVREEIPEAAGLLYDTVLRAVLSRPTVAALAEFLRDSREHTEGAGGDGPADSPLVPLGGAGPSGSGAEGPEGAGDAAMRVLVHDGMGTLAAYRPLIPLLDGPGPLVGLAVPAHEPYAREDPEDLIVRRAAHYTRCLLETGHTRFQVVGYCMGGLLATEVARQLAESGALVENLTIVSSYALPHTIEDELVLEYVFARLLNADTEELGYPDDAATAHVFRAVLERTPGRVPSGSPDSLTGDLVVEEAARRFAALRKVPQRERLAAIGRAARGDGESGGGESGGGGFPMDLEAVYSLYRTSMTAVTRHRATPYAGDVVLLREDEATGFLPWLRADMTEFWGELCLGELEIVDVPGDHFSCMRPPHVGRVARELDRLHRGGGR
ncbi:non-ribosomal peptide synthetase [Streptomyces mangrovi]|uniref:non-ribosomal peptide synthetase n=1 Tax=Streptomyces mangrovi TaxID=1206892 RepID=UPI00399D33EC